MNLHSFKNKSPEIHDTTWIADNAIIIGDTSIGEQSSVWWGCVVRGDVNAIRIGKRTNIQDLTLIHCAELGQGTYIGNNITVGHSAVLHACSIEDNAFIGIQSCVMDDCIVEKGAMLGAGALLTPGKVIPTGEVWTGRPAKKQRDINEKDLAFFAINQQRYIRLAQEYKQQNINVLQGKSKD